jgi:hypothetical protein
MNNRLYWGRGKRNKITTPISKKSSKSTSKRSMKKSMRRLNRLNNSKNQKSKAKSIRSRRNSPKLRQTSLCISKLHNPLCRSKRVLQRRNTAVLLAVLVTKTSRWQTTPTLTKSLSTSTTLMKMVFSISSVRKTFPAYGRTRTRLEGSDRLPLRLAAVASKT